MRKAQLIITNRIRTSFVSNLVIRPVNRNLLVIEIYYEKYDNSALSIFMGVCDGCREWGFFVKRHGVVDA